GGEIVVSKAYDGEFLGKQFVGRQIAQRGNKFALGEVPGGAEDDHDARVAGAAGLLIVVNHVVRSLGCRSQMRVIGTSVYSDLAFPQRRKLNTPSTRCGRSK